MAEIKKTLECHLNPHKEIKKSDKDDYLGKYERQYKCIFYTHNIKYTIFTILKCTVQW